MAKGKKRPGERRRVKKRRRQKKDAPGFHRPVEWAQAELVGVLGWLKRLKGAEAEDYPVSWRAGQIKHYQKRARELRAEIRATEAAAAAKKSEGENGPNVA